MAFIRVRSSKAMKLYTVEKKFAMYGIGFVELQDMGFRADVTPGVGIGWCLAADYYNQVHVKKSLSESVMQKTSMVKAGKFYHPKLSNDSSLWIYVLYGIDL